WHWGVAGLPVQSLIDDSPSGISVVTTGSSRSQPEHFLVEARGRITQSDPLLGQRTIHVFLYQGVDGPPPLRSVIRLCLWILACALLCGLAGTYYYHRYWISDIRILIPTLITPIQLVRRGNVGPICLSSPAGAGPAFAVVLPSRRRQRF